MDNMIFPLDITNKPNDYFVLTCESKSFESPPDGVLKWEKNMKDAVLASMEGNIILPIPNSLSDSTSHSWNATEGFGEELGETLGNLGGGLTEKLLGSAAGAATAVAKKAFAKSGYSIDPMYWQQYSGTEPRSFSFSWTLVPSNVTEATALMDILKTLKKWSAPRVAGKTGLLGVSVGIQSEPFTFNVAFSNPVIHDAIRLKGLVCTGIDIDYSGQGYSDFHADGYPKQVNLSLNFNERATMYQEDWA